MSVIRSRFAVQPYLTRLRASMADELPARGLALIDGHRWSDRMLATCALLWAVVGGQTLGARLAGARDAVLKMYASRLRPGATYEGFVKALVARGDGLMCKLVEHLRARRRNRSPRPPGAGGSAGGSRSPPTRASGACR